MATKTDKTDFEYLARVIAVMKRDDVKDEIMGFDGRFKLDFSEDYLEHLTVDRLRHILLAAKIQQSQIH